MLVNAAISKLIGCVVGIEKSHLHFLSCCVRPLPSLPYSSQWPSDRYRRITVLFILTLFLNSQCDESRPSCSNCIRRQLPCDFLSTETPEPSVSPSGLNMTDLELLHNYMAFTYLTLADNPVRGFFRSCAFLYFHTCPWKVTYGSRS